MIHGDETVKDLIKEVKNKILYYSYKSSIYDVMISDKNILKIINYI